jgi:hypothetical protein
MERAMGIEQIQLPKVRRYYPLLHACAPADFIRQTQAGLQTAPVLRLVREMTCEVGRTGFSLGTASIEKSSLR